MKCAVCMAAHVDPLPKAVTMAMGTALCGTCFESQAAGDLLPPTLLAVGSRKISARQEAERERRRGRDVGGSW